jgi:hypothetical protein
MEAALTHEAFNQQAGTKFQVQVDDNNNVEVELVDVSELKVYPRQEEFTIQFLGPAGTFLGQGVRSFLHDQMGQFEIFIVPVRQDEQGFYYDAIFNRIRE